MFAAVSRCELGTGLNKGVDGVAGLAPPLEAYGALIAGYARRKDADLALSALQDFFELGGQPDFQMFDTVLEVCVRTGHFRRAMQVQTELDVTPTITASSQQMCKRKPPMECCSALVLGTQVCGRHQQPAIANAVGLGGHSHVYVIMAMEAPASSWLASTLLLIVQEVRNWPCRW